MKASQVAWEEKAQPMLKAAAFICLERYAPLPRDEIVIFILFSFCDDLSACHLDDQFQQFVAGSLKRVFSGYDSAGVKIDDIGHPVGHLGVGGYFDHRTDGVAGGSAESGGKQDDICSASSQAGGAFDIVSWRIEQVQSWILDVFRVIQ